MARYFGENLVMISGGVYMVCYPGCPLIRIYPVAEGIKSAELRKLTFSCKECVEAKFLGRVKVLYLGRGFYLVYNEDLIKKLLFNPCALGVLSDLGYSRNLSFNLGRLKDRFAKQCPGEIGFFLGYPTKDVLGFMGFSGFVYGKTLGWRMYEPVASSESLYHLYKEARLCSWCNAKR